jgi:intermediate peptidase
MLSKSTKGGLSHIRRYLTQTPRCPNEVLRIQSRRATTKAIPAGVDELSLIPFFDQPHGHRSSSLASTGLFQHRGLSHPQALTILAEGTLRRAQFLTNRILQARESRDQLRLVIKNLDKLSDLLCGVIDLAELLRNAHPDPAWAESANNAYEMLCEFMNVLNTHVGLYHVSAHGSDPIA